MYVCVYVRAHSPPKLVIRHRKPPEHSERLSCFLLYLILSMLSSKVSPENEDEAQTFTLAEDEKGEGEGEGQGQEEEKDCLA